MWEITYFMFKRTLPGTFHGDSERNQNFLFKYSSLIPIEPFQFPTNTDEKRKENVT